MIAVSSMRLDVDCPPEIRRNQEAARFTWDDNFEDYQIFWNSEAPTIQFLCDWCSRIPGWSAIVNGDIVIGPNWPAVEQALNRTRAVCAISKRYELGPDKNQASARVVDNGLDFFAARPEIWAMAAMEVPPEFRLGKIFWDTWMLGFFMHASKGECADLTDSRVIFHPRHGNRGQQQIEVPPLKYPPTWPVLKIKVPVTARAASKSDKPGGGGALII